MNTDTLPNLLTIPNKIVGSDKVKSLYKLRLDHIMVKDLSELTFSTRNNHVCSEKEKA